MKYITTMDILIPKGTEFENCDGEKLQFVDDNYMAIVGDGKDNVVTVVVQKETLDRVIKDKYVLTEVWKDGIVKYNQLKDK